MTSSNVISSLHFSQIGNISSNDFLFKKLSRKLAASDVLIILTYNAFFLELQIYNLLCLPIR